MEKKERWIFQDIRDIKDEYLYGKSGALKNKLPAYNQALRERVSPELYVRFMIWQCDVYVDLFSIQVATTNVYPQVTNEQVAEWVDMYKSEHHIVTSI